MILVRYGIPVFGNPVFFMGRIWRKTKKQRLNAIWPSLQEIVAACKDLSLRPCEEQMHSEMDGMLGLDTFLSKNPGKYAEG